MEKSVKPRYHDMVKKNCILNRGLYRRGTKESERKKQSEEIWLCLT